MKNALTAPSGFCTPPGWARPRSVLFAPGNRADLLAKLPRSRPDAVVIDLEDAVPAGAKASARAVAHGAALALRAAAPDLAVFLRVNALHSPHFAGDMDLLTPALSGGLSGVMVPKLETAAETRQVAQAAAARGIALPLFAGLETAAGVWNAREIMADPAVAWAYKLGNRSALEWVLERHKETTPKDATIREKFNTYRFADHKERVIDLLARVTTVSVETMRIVGAMPGETV